MSKTGPGWLLYGASGFTGTLLAEEAVRRGLSPVLGGRSLERVGPLAERLGLEATAFSLDAPDLASRLASHDAVLHAAGPFSATSAPMLEACIASETHYLDITGEITVFLACEMRSGAARDAGCVVMPGVGFDVVPSDCLALGLSEALPGATSLELAFHSGGRASRGTLKTMIEGLHEGGAIREGGRIVRVPTAAFTRTVPFSDRPRTVVSIPWGDVATAFHTTGIPDITVYTAVAPGMVAWMRRLHRVLSWTRSRSVRAALRRLIDMRAPGPGEAERRASRCQLWGRVENAAGEEVEGTLETPEGYSLTASAGIEAIRRVLRGEVAPGYRTPASAFGSGFIKELFEAAPPHEQTAGCELRIPAIRP